MSLADAKATSTGQILSSAVRVYGLHYVTSSAGGSAGQIVLKDGGSGGTTRVDLDTPAKDDAQEVDFAQNGILFSTDVHLSTLLNVDSVTLFYSDDI